MLWGKGRLSCLPLRFDSCWQNTLYIINALENSKQLDKVYLYKFSAINSCVKAIHYWLANKYAETPSQNSIFVILPINHLGGIHLAGSTLI